MYLTDECATAATPVLSSSGTASILTYSTTAMNSSNFKYNWSVLRTNDLIETAASSAVSQSFTLAAATGTQGFAISWSA